MLDAARDIIGNQPILTAFLAIGLGYLVGQISIFGFSLGVGAVLFVGLAIGAFAPKAQITGPIGLTGLVMFLYGIGILYGVSFSRAWWGSDRSTICWHWSHVWRVCSLHSAWDTSSGSRSDIHWASMPDR